MGSVMMLPPLWLALCRAGRSACARVASASTLKVHQRDKRLQTGQASEGGRGGRVRVSPHFPPDRHELDGGGDSLPPIAIAEARKEIGRFRMLFLRHGDIEPF